ncbi:hypothetical protein AGDE_03861 [Angomonas deanei]|nr:hypothetical protein AGDE_03861 [Angomonas deanei]|eukprot:EPY40067.1 hypothetical protein AGDE_03861 [Angomonas deanei]
MNRIFQSVKSSSTSDPLYDALHSHLHKRKVLLEFYKQQRRRKRRSAALAAKLLKGRKIESLSGDEMYQLSQLMAEEVKKAFGKNCTSTVKNDPQMLAAINQYRANLWMTDDALGELIHHRDEFVRPIGELAEVVGGVDRPVLFGDVANLRHPYGNPVAYQCMAPQIGTRTNPTGKKEVAVSMVVFTHKPHKLLFEPHVLRNSHRCVREQYGQQVSPKHLAVRFLPMEVHIPEQIKRFTFDKTVVGEPLNCDAIEPGSVLVMDPHLMTAFGPNFTNAVEVLYRINVVSETAKPSVKPPSWIRGWRSTAGEINFISPKVFPRLY